MGRLTHKLAAAAFACLLATTPHPLRAAQPIDLVSEFAQCAGRLSAQMEHQWLISDSKADHTKQHRAVMIELLEAVTDPAAAKQTRHLRIMTKQAHAQLLTQSIFSQNDGHKAYAHSRAQHLIARCMDFLLS
ncbi:hypothetical protein [Pacificibacter sp. AS14]|uniref:hypothetical protein n=1 Tax=Pacificibacter sp. AS14 TaxID=3135785 RepID=UPI00316FE9B8